jgi:hypothetical protein
MMFQKTKMEKAVSIRLSLIVAATIATLGLGSPALAQALPSHADGTGSPLPDYWDREGTLHFGYTLQQQEAGLYAYTGPMFAPATGPLYAPATPQQQADVHGRGLYAQLWALRLRRHR